MRAIIVSSHGGPEVLKLEQRPDLSPSADQVVVDIHAAGVNPVETYQRAGSQGYAGQLPFTPGGDGAGTVRETGSNVSGLSVGDRVYVAGSITGTYADQCLCRADQVFRLPDSLSFEQGAALWVNYGTSFRALFQRGGARPGDRLLIHGATGGVGVAALQWAWLFGLETFGTYGSPHGRELVIAQGASGAVDHTAADHSEELSKAAGPSGFDVIVEMLANVNLELDLGLLSRRGRVLIVGSRGSIEITPRQLMGREADVRGVMLYGASPREVAEIHAAIAAGARGGAISPIIHERIKLEDAGRAHELIMESGSHGKIVLVP